MFTRPGIDQAPPPEPSKPTWQPVHRSLEQLDAMHEYEGIYFNRATGETFYWCRLDSGLVGHRDDGPAVALRAGYTFEPAAWWGSFMGQWMSGWLNPLGFATEETSGKVLDATFLMLRHVADVSIERTQNAGGFFNRTLERRILLRNKATGAAHEYSVGRLAVSMMREGTAKAILRLWDEARRDIGL